MRDSSTAALVFGSILVLAAALATGCASGDSGTSSSTGGGAGSGGAGGFAGVAGVGTGGATGGTAGVGATGGTGGGFQGECTENEQRPCYSGPAGTDGVGECKAGTQLCVNGYWGTCTGEVAPTAEVCNGLDDDCNGLADEQLGQTTCGMGACAVTVDNCVDGQPQTCTPGTGNTVEQCDGVDDNCDGQVDEGCSCQDGQTQSCYTGAPATKNVGECAAGTQTCTNGAWGSCDNEVLPATELCDGLDNDCNGKTDEGNPEGGQACQTGKQGVCAAGTTSCVNSTKICNQTAVPSPEVCDGLDNNCNGTADEGNPEGGSACQTGLPGVCAAGTKVCEGGTVKCKQDTQASTETCDGVDNNCNGQTDEGCNCVNGQTQSCYTGAPSTKDVGPCHGGTQTCANGNWGSCVGQVLPKGETCNAIDDDCDGTPDDGNPGGGAACTTGLPGICSAGTMTCQAGALSCKQNQTANPSDICNNSLDDNCNGQVDENCSGGPCAHDKCVTGVALTSGCGGDPCVTQVCASDSFCCSNTWDSFCVSEVRTYCGSLKCDEAKGNCPHTLCTTGTTSQPFTTGCDSAKANCVSQICAVDSYCCSTDWDSICVGEVVSECNKNCN
ncbi:MAG: hypothetical protein KC776_34625 [Myxococcales bacterium]|nr:hypothetical protein [Myxococcales bacterium]MCB9579581.1 hypothetical protein [Polyangiaceae bacterium]